MIEKYDFGSMQVGEKVYRDDLKIVRGKIVYPWWRKSGHRVEPEDVQDILETDPEILVLGMGKPGMMKASSALRSHLESKGVQLIEAPTAEAVQSFNRLWESSKNVGAGFHLTC